MRRFGPVSRFSFDDVKIVVYALTGGYAQVPFGFMSMPTSPIRFGISSESRYGSPHSKPFPDWIWSDSREPGNYDLDEVCRAVVMAAVELAGGDVRYDEATDTIVDERGVTDYSIEASEAVRTGIQFMISMKRGEEIVGSLLAWARKERGDWSWVVEMADLHGRARDEDDARRMAMDATEVWWATVGPMMALEESDG
jgi:hypothetical protein